MLSSHDILTRLKYDFFFLKKPLEPESRPPMDSTCYSVDIPAYGANIRLVKCNILYSFRRVVHPPWVGRLRNCEGGERGTDPLLQPAEKEREELTRSYDPIQNTPVL